MKTNIMKIRDIVRRHEGFSEASLRWYIKNADKNGLGTALRRIGRSIFIDEDLFLAWIESKQSKA